jgi:glycerol-3-phosphate O-acyltransferase
MLGQRLLADYRRATVALSSSVLAYVLFEQVRRAHPKRDIFRLLRVLGPQLTFSSDALMPDIARALGELSALAARGELVLAPALAARDPEQVLRQGAATLSMYHRVPVLTREGTLLRIGDPALLFYYRNRLDGYGLLGTPSLKGWSTRRGERVVS